MEPRGAWEINEYIFILGSDKHSPQSRSNSLAKSTLSILLRSLNDEGEHRITVFDYVTGHQQSAVRRAGRQRSHLLSSLKISIPLGQGVTHLWDYLRFCCKNRSTPFRLRLVERDANVLACILVAYASELIWGSRARLVRRPINVASSPQLTGK